MNIDNRDMDYVKRYVDSEITNMRDSIWNRLLPLGNTKPLVEKGGMHYCPACGKFFSCEHTAAMPNFCEDCGQALEWPEAEHDE